MKIRVTKQDIVNGRRRDFKRNPLALVLKRRFKTADVSVSPESVRIHDLRYWLPRELVWFLDDFYDKKPVKPFTFEFKRLKLWTPKDYDEWLRDLPEDIKI